MPRKATSGEGKRHPLALRTTKELREALEHAAARSGRSLAQEIEHRLEESLARERSPYLYVGYLNWRAPLIPHKGELVLVLDGPEAISLTIDEEDLAKFRARIDAVREGQ